MACRAPTAVARRACGVRSRCTDRSSTSQSRSRSPREIARVSRPFLRDRLVARTTLSTIGIRCSATGGWIRHRLRDDDLVLSIDCRLAVVTLHEAVAALHDPTLGVGEIALRLRSRRPVLRSRHFCVGSGVAPGGRSRSSFSAALPLRAAHGPCSGSAAFSSSSRASRSFARRRSSGSSSPRLCLPCCPPRRPPLRLPSADPRPSRSRCSSFCIRS